MTRRARTALRLMAIVLAVLVTPTNLHAGGPLKVAGITYFNSGVAGTPLSWKDGVVRYFTDQGELSPGVSNEAANALVADAFARWTSVSTAAISAVHAGELAEDVSSANVIATDVGHITMPADIQPTATAIPVAIVYDADGKVTDALLGSSASTADMCSTNSVYGGADNYSTDAHLSHALVVLNGNCAQTTADITALKYRLVRLLGRVLGLDWADLNANVATNSPPPTSDDYLGFSLMHAREPACIGKPVPCIPGADQPKMDDRAAISRLYSVTAANVADFPGKQVFSETTARVRGSVFFLKSAGLVGQPMQGVKVVARWVDPATGVASHAYVASSISGFLFRGNAGNPVTGWIAANGERFDKFGSNDPDLEGYFDLAGLEFPDGGSAAQYELSVEAVDPICSGEVAVGPYFDGQIKPSGTAQSIVVTVTKGAEIVRDVLMIGSALQLSDHGGTFAVPGKIPLGGEWLGSLSGYGNVDYFFLSARANRTMTFEVAALDEAARPTVAKALPVVGIWEATDAPGSPPHISEQPFNTARLGVTSVNAKFVKSTGFKLGIADFRGDGRPDFRYRARVFYADTVSPTRASVSGGTALTIHGMGFRPGITAAIGSNSAPVIAQSATTLVVSTPALPDGTYDLELRDAGGLTTTISDVTFGAAASDKIILLQGSNPATPLGGEAQNPMRVRVVTADGLTPVAGASINFTAFPAGVLFLGCNASACTIVTDAQGEASTRLVATSTTTMTITASLPSGGNVRATLVGSSGALDINLVSPRTWMMQGTTAAVPLTARVLSHGLPVANTAVNFQIMQGASTLNPRSAVTGSDGYAASTLNVSNLSGEIHVSACLAPTNSPCQNFYIYVVARSAVQLEAVAGDQQTINTNHQFGCTVLRVTDSASPTNPVRAASVSFRVGVFRWQSRPQVTSGPPFTPPPQAVLVKFVEATLLSDANGLVVFTSAPDPGYGAVVVNVTALAGSAALLQFQLQRLWPSAPLELDASLYPAPSYRVTGPGRVRPSRNYRDLRPLR